MVDREEMIFKENKVYFDVYSCCKGKIRIATRKNMDKLPKYPINKYNSQSKEEVQK